MKAVSIINMKGGVGKTTLTVNIAHGLAEAFGKRVLVVDVDPQFNASTYLMPTDTYLGHVNSEERKTVYDIFVPNARQMSTVQARQRKQGVGSVSLEDCVHEVEVSSGALHLIPSVLDLMGLQFADRGTENRLKNFLLKQAQGYDYVLIDCPPTISIYTQAAILASDAYLVPLKPDPLSAIGLPLLDRWLSEFQETAAMDLPALGIVFVMDKKQRTKQMAETIREVKDVHGDKVFEPTLRNTTHVAASASFSTPFASYVRMSKKDAGGAVDDMKAIVTEFLNRARTL